MNLKRTLKMDKFFSRSFWQVVRILNGNTVTCALKLAGGCERAYLDDEDSNLQSPPGNDPCPGKVHHREVNFTTESLESEIKRAATRSRAERVAARSRFIVRLPNDLESELNLPRVSR
jgi:hypothetical protein